MKIRISVIVITLLSAIEVSAEVLMPAVFSKNMVLQQSEKVAVWGWADPGEEIIVRFADQEAYTKADKNGKWLVRLRAMKASANGRMLRIFSLTEKSVIKIPNVLVGEVWLCSGQSNTY